MAKLMPMGPESLTRERREARKPASPQKPVPGGSDGAAASIAASAAAAPSLKPSATSGDSRARGTVKSHAAVTILAPVAAGGRGA